MARVTVKHAQAQPHKSHRMGKTVCEVRAPAGTPRFYSVQRCTACGHEKSDHAAGHFIDEGLVKPCLAATTAKGRKVLSVKGQTDYAMECIRDGTAMLLRALDSAHGAESMMLLGHAESSAGPGNALEIANRLAKRGLTSFIEAEKTWNRLTPKGKKR